MKFSHPFRITSYLMALMVLMSSTIAYTAMRDLLTIALAPIFGGYIGCKHQHNIIKDHGNRNLYTHPAKVAAYHTVAALQGGATVLATKYMCDHYSLKSALGVLGIGALASYLTTELFGRVAFEDLNKDEYKDTDKENSYYSALRAHLPASEHSNTLKAAEAIDLLQCHLNNSNLKGARQCLEDLQENLQEGLSELLDNADNPLKGVPPRSLSRLNIHLYKQAADKLGKIADRKLIPLYDKALSRRRGPFSAATSWTLGATTVVGLRQLLP